MYESLHESKASMCVEADGRAFCLVCVLILPSLMGRVCQPTGRPPRAPNGSRITLLSPTHFRTHTTSECGGNVVEDTGSITIRVFGSVDVCVDAPTLSLSTQPTVVIFVCTYMCMIDSFRCCAHAQIDWLEGLEAVRCHVWTVLCR